MSTNCEWCGHEHSRDALCTKRPKWSRRGFIAMFGMGVAGLALGRLNLPRPEEAFVNGIVRSEMMEIRMRFDPLLRLWDSEFLVYNGTSGMYVLDERTHDPHTTIADATAHHL